MKPPFKPRAPAFDAEAIHATLRNAWASAGLDTRSGPMVGLTETLRRALSPAAMFSSTGRMDASNAVIDGVTRVVDLPSDGHAGSARRPLDPRPATRQTPSNESDGHDPLNPAGSRAYKLYLPRSLKVPALAAPALIVMLHGCQQSADDFAAGTRMNRLADEHGFLVVYPEQASSANPSKCWNWFQPQDQGRGAGEPAFIARIVREVVARHGVDPHRVFVAGLSAGAAMAVILGQTYPDLFAGVGAHSGLPYRSAHDLASALVAMKGGRGRSSAGPVRAGTAGSAPGHPIQAVPTIVFHGDRDHTVQPGSSTAILQQATLAHAAHEARTVLHATTERGTAKAGRSYSRTSHTDADGRSQFESWVVHGAGHAWAGGSANGSFTDAQGPDASAEMVRFFLGLRGPGSA